MVADYKISLFVDTLALLNHLLNLVAPAWGVGALLAVALAWRARAQQTFWRGWWGHCVWLGLAGSAVLAAALPWLGRDGRMVTYVALVVVLGGLAAWRDARRA
jgi:hypothetical protein